MELRAFAERILFGDTLADKLGSASSFTDMEAGAPRVAERPARPRELAFPSGRVRDALPTPAQLEDPRARGRLLHRFANHELLAIEIMAATLLAFPDAPAPFRRALGATIGEEQGHLRLYLARMAQLGVEPGEIPVSDYFWRACADMRTPLDYVLRMSLVFEQANLDFTRHYRDLFGAVGDRETVAVLDRVYEDEIGHVRLGLGYLRRWKEAGRSDWEAFEGGLSLPLSPARARGAVFDREGRERAGFDADFIDRVEVFGGSRGRPARVYWFNPACEAEIARGRAGETPARSVRDLAADLSPLMALLASAEDVVVCPEPPDARWCREWASAGFAVPEFVRSMDALSGRKLGDLQPWGWSPDAEVICAGLRPSLIRPADGWRSGREVASSKVAALTWRAEVAARLHADWVLAGEGIRVDDEGTAVACVERGWVLKTPWSTAGRDRLRGRLDAPARGWIRRSLQAFGSLRAEPWLDRRLDFSFHYDLVDGQMRFRGTCQFHTDESGQFSGTSPGRWTAALDPELGRFLDGQGSDRRRLRRVADALGEVLAGPLAAAGHQGPVGVDAMVVQSADGLRMDPLVEVNPRWTMGRLSLALERRIHGRARARWEFVSIAALEKSGVGKENWVREHSAPLELVDGLIRRGVLWTTDPTRARRILTRLTVD